MSEYLTVPVVTNKNGIVNSIDTRLDESNKTLTFYCLRDEVVSMLFEFERSRSAWKKSFLQHLREVDENELWEHDESKESARKFSGYEMFYVPDGAESVLYYDFSFTQFVVPLKLKNKN